jgi:stage II sporulation protein E
MELGRGKYMLAVSDGMGSGGRAKEESAASVELFESFMEAGFQRDAALEQINSLLLMNADNEDIFATLDICNVDLYKGTAEFVKIGGMPSFICGDKGVRLVGGGGLPIGIVDRTETESTQLKLEDGETIVMVTDGVTEAAPCAIGKESWLAKRIDENRELPPEGLCEKITQLAIQASGGCVKDDMTVLVAKIWRV